MYQKELLNLNIPPDIAGFTFLNEVIQVYKPLMPIMTIYEKVAVKFITSSSKAERAMRHAITHTKEFDYDGNFLSVGRFIAKYKILLEAGEKQ